MSFQINQFENPENTLSTSVIIGEKLMKLMNNKVETTGDDIFELKKRMEKLEERLTRIENKNTIDIEARKYVRYESNK